MKTLIWVHADCLHRESPAFRRHPAAPALFVWDEAWMRSQGWTLKRIGFIYECLLDLPVEIRKGDPLLEVPRTANELGCEAIVTVDTPDPHLRAQAAAMGAEILPADPFGDLRGPIDLKRFSRYWAKAQRALGV